MLAPPTTSESPARAVVEAGTCAGALMEPELRGRRLHMNRTSHTLLAVISLVLYVHMNPNMAHNTEHRRCLGAATPAVLSGRAPRFLPRVA